MVSGESWSIGPRTYTAHPITVWTFEITASSIEISSTFTNTVVTAQAPAPLSRIPVRTLDPEGFPVELDRRRLFDQPLDPVAVYRNRLKAIRDTIGMGRFLEIARLECH